MASTNLLARWRHPACGVVERIAWLFADHGSSRFDGARREAVTALEHALQCAQLAELGGAAPPLVAAALLHDIGHFLIPRPVAEDHQGDDHHEELSAALLEGSFGPEVTSPIRLHVAAKRYLSAIDRAYFAALSPASRHSLLQQGGPMTSADRAEFSELPYADEALRLRRWDDLAKRPGRETPPLVRYLRLLDRLRTDVR